jgi:hypothetical protein
MVRVRFESCLSYLTGLTASTRSAGRADPVRRAGRTGPNVRRTRIRQRAQAAAREEQGAALVLALVFMVAAGGIIIALLGWGSNNLENVAHFQQGRTLENAADSAMAVAIQQVRYTPSTSVCPTSGYLSIPGSDPASTPNPASSPKVTIDIWCSTQTSPTSANTRVVTLEACSDSAVPGTCSQASPYLTVVVTFGDYSSPNQYATPTCSTTCGTTMSINSWKFR